MYRIFYDYVCKQHLWNSFEKREKAPAFFSFTLEAKVISTHTCNQHYKFNPRGSGSQNMQAFEELGTGKSENQPPHTVAALLCLLGILEDLILFHVLL